MLLIYLHSIPIFSTEIVRNESWYICRSIEAHKIRNRSTKTCSFKAIRPRHCERSQVSTIAPAADDKTVGVRNSHFNQLIDSRLGVFIVAVTPVVDVGVTKLLAVSAAAPW